MGPGLGGAQPQFAGSYGHDLDFQHGQEARRRGVAGSSLAPQSNEEQSGYIDEKVALMGGGVPPPWQEDDTGKTLGSKGFEAGPGRGGRRGLPPIAMRRPITWVN